MWVLIIIAIILIQLFLSRQVKFPVLGFILPIIYLIYSVYMMVTTATSLGMGLLLLIGGEAVLLDIQYHEFTKKKRQPATKNKQP
ncbi:hypothetical protein [Fructilactobacillus carniphilus]|uniref:Uncharacterized protein n=1 Tax=Fructilactobacillus carniphilus TaxID=2940297 RepID=A0ABY5BYK6_9LACO|nr:hypothetical protein [Fructilactobacillus carniphilus]USS90915.1 hypothetical protein M3M37_01535 [Fructilactobacillus carniphilus]